MPVHLPAGHGVHAWYPPALWNLPAGQASQLVLPVHSCALPAAQSAHSRAAALVSWYLPLGHLWHEMAEGCECEPSGHALQPGCCLLSSFASANFPAGHATQP